MAPPWDSAALPPPCPLSPQLPPGSQASLLLSPPHLTGHELAAVQGMLEAGWLAPAGPYPAAFEAAFAATSGFPHVLAVASGTAALHLGYHCLDLAPGDEVWTTTFTFAATIAPAVQMGARPRFLDICPASWTLDPGLLAAELAQAARRGRLPRAVVPVDLYGQSCELDAIRTACDRWGVPVLCDSAEGLGATLRGRPAGLGARLACFSFNGNKIITAGGGGALASADAALIARARRLASQAKEQAAHYQHETTGFSYAMSSLFAAVGLAQLAALPERVAARRAVFQRYQDALAGLPGIAFMPEPAWGRSSRWLTALTIDPSRFGADREEVRHHLAAAGVESRPLWKPLHLQPAFRDAPCVGGAQAAALFEHGLCLPSGSGMTAAQQDRVIGLVRDCHRP